MHVYSPRDATADPAASTASGACHTMNHLSRRNAGLIAVVAAQAGDVATVRSILDSFLERSRREWLSPLMIAQLHQALGDNDAAFHWYDRAYQVRENLLTVLHADRSWQLSPPGAPLVTSDPRWDSLIRRIGAAP